MGYRNYSTAVSHIVDATGQGDFTTISAAIAAATSGQSIFIRPGIYTENPPLKAGVNLVAFDADSYTPNVIINGKCTFSSAGTVTLSGMRLQTNGDFCLAVTGSAASVVNLTHCYINCLNNTGISYTSSSSSSSININNCDGNIGTAGAALVIATGTGIVATMWSTFSNTGGTTTLSTSSACPLVFLYCVLGIPIGCTGIGELIVEWTDINTSAVNTSCITTAGTSSSNIQCGRMISGSASALSIGAGTTLQVTGGSSVLSTNTNAITGAGTLEYGRINFTPSSSTGVNVTTQTFLFERPYPLFSSYLSATATNVTGDGTTYTVAWNSAIKNQTNSFNPSTGVFTAPTVGSYQFNVSLALSGLTSADTAALMTIVTTARTYVFCINNPGSAQEGGALTCTGSCLADMSAGDTAEVQVTVSGSTKTVNIIGGASAASIFSGYFIN